MLICFNSLSSSICIKDVDRCWQADMQAVWATFPCLKQISKPKISKQRNKQKYHIKYQKYYAPDIFLFLFWGIRVTTGLSVSAFGVSMPFSIEIKINILVHLSFSGHNIIKTLTPHRKIKIQIKNYFRSLETSQVF